MFISIASVLLLILVSDIHCEHFKNSTEGESNVFNELVPPRRIRHKVPIPRPVGLSVRTESPDIVEILTEPPNEKSVGSYPNNFNPFYPQGSYPYNPTSGVNPGYPLVPGTPTSAGNDLQAFTARRAVIVGHSPESRIRFTDVVSQLGRGYHPETSEFVCGTPGYFFFTFSSCGQQYAHFRVTLKHNEIGVLSAFGDREGFQMASNSAVLFLNLGDRVYLELSEGGLYEVNTVSGRAYNSFTGFRIL